MSKLLDIEINDFAKNIKCSRYENRTCKYSNGRACECRSSVINLKEIKKLEEIENSVVDEFGNYIAIKKGNEILIYDKFKIGNKVKITDNILEKTVIGTIVSKIRKILVIKTKDGFASMMFKRMEECKSCISNFV